MNTVVLETVLSVFVKLSDTTSMPRNAAINFGTIKIPTENVTPNMIPQHQMIYCADDEEAVTMIGMMIAPTIVAL